MSWEIGGCSFSFGPRPLREALQILKDLGFDIADLGVCLGNTQVHPVRAAENPERTASEVIEVLREMRMRPEECFVLDFGEPVNHPEDRVRRRTGLLFRGLAKFASLVGFRSVMLIPGIVDPSLGRERSFELSVMALRELVKMSDDAGVQLNIEPCQPSVAEAPQDAIRLCEEVPG
jgi:sugar phosphate isomerase/epimerase